TGAALGIVQRRSARGAPVRETLHALLGGWTSMDRHAAVRKAGRAPARSAHAQGDVAVPAAAGRMLAARSRAGRVRTGVRPVTSVPWRGVVVLLAMAASTAAAQGLDTAANVRSPIFVANTPNVKLLSHIPLGRSETISGIAMEQDMSRPYVYVSRMQDLNSPAGFSLISVKDPAHAKVIY